MFIDGIKFSCEPCVRGHRQANCNHADRALVEVKKKGRPKTQCQSCHERRLATGGHIRCICPKAPERPPLELPNGALSQDLPAPLVRNTSTSSSTSSASSRAPSVSVEARPAEIVRKKSIKRKESNASTKPHDLAHGAHHHHTHVFAPYHTPLPHCRSTPMTRAPSVTSAEVPVDLQLPIVELPPLPPLPQLETATSFELPSQELVTPEGVEAILASLEASYSSSAEVGGVRQEKEEAEWSTGGAEFWTAPSSVESVGSSDISYSTTPDLGPWAATEDSFDLSAEIDKWRQVLEVELVDLHPPILPLGPEWIAPYLTAEPEYTAPFTSAASFLPPPPAFDLPSQPYMYDEGFFSSSSTSSSKTASSVAGSDYSTPVCQSNQLSLSLADIYLSMDSAYDLGFGGGGYWDGVQVENGGMGPTVAGEQARVGMEGNEASGIAT